MRFLGHSYQATGFRRVLASGKHSFKSIWSRTAFIELVSNRVRFNFKQFPRVVTYFDMVKSVSSTSYPARGESRIKRGNLILSAGWEN
jgi:hypothetical protein